MSRSRRSRSPPWTRGGGFWHTAGGEYRVAKLDERGDTVMLLEAEVDPLPVTAEDRREFVESSSRGTPEVRAAAEEVAALMPETKPVVANLIVDDRGRLWVERSVPEGEAPVFDVFAADGAHRATVRLGFRPFAPLPVRIRHGQLHALVLDSLDVPRVVRAPLPASLANGLPPGFGVGPEEWLSPLARRPRPG